MDQNGGVLRIKAFVERLSPCSSLSRFSKRRVSHFQRIRARRAAFGEAECGRRRLSPPYADSPRRGESARRALAHGLLRLSIKQGFLCEFYTIPPLRRFAGRSYKKPRRLTFSHAAAFSMLFYFALSQTPRFALSADSCAARRIRRSRMRQAAAIAAALCRFAPQGRIGTPRAFVNVTAL